MPHAGISGLARGAPMIETRRLVCSTGRLYRPCTTTGSPQVTPRATPCTGCERFVTESGIGPIPSHHRDLVAGWALPASTPMPVLNQVGGAPASGLPGPWPRPVSSASPGDGSRRAQRRSRCRPVRGPGDPALSARPELTGGWVPPLVGHPAEQARPAGASLPRPGAARSSPVGRRPVPVELVP
jgi:hypothetical protein